MLHVASLMILMSSCPVCTCWTGALGSGDAVDGDWGVGCWVEGAEVRLREVDCASVAARRR